MLGTEVGSRHYPASLMRPEASPVPLGLAEWWLEVGCWLPKPAKQNISRHRGGQEIKRVGSVVACHWLAAGSPPCNPTLSHPVGEGWLADQWQLASGSPPAGHWCYICRVGGHPCRYYTATCRWEANSAACKNVCRVATRSGHSASSGVPVNPT